VNLYTSADVASTGAQSFTFSPDIAVTAGVQYVAYLSVFGDGDAKPDVAIFVNHRSLHNRPVKLGGVSLVENVKRTRQPTIYRFEPVLVLLAPPRHRVSIYVGGPRDVDVHVAVWPIVAAHSATMNVNDRGDILGQSAIVWGRGSLGLRSVP
jgi:hypothetical protein